MLMTKSFVNVKGRLVGAYNHNSIIFVIFKKILSYLEISMHKKTTIIQSSNILYDVHQQLLTRMEIL